MCGIVAKYEGIQNHWSDAIGTIGHINYGKMKPYLGSKYPLAHYRLKMNILNFLEKDRSFVIIDSSFQNRLKKLMTSVVEMASQLNVSRTTLQRVLNQKEYPIRLSIYLDLVKILKISTNVAISNALYVKTKNSSPVKCKNIKCNKMLGRVLGHVLGDGGIHVVKKDNKYRTFYVNNEPKLLESFKMDINSLFPGIEMYSRERVWHGDEIWLPSTVGLVFYKMLEYEKFGEKRVPSIIKNLDNPKIVGSFLQALFDDEGTVSVSKKMVVISLGNQTLLNEVRELTLRLGIHANPIRKIVPKDRSTMFRFSITRKENLEKFRKCVGFMHPKKKSQLSKMINSYKVR